MTKLLISATVLALLASLVAGTCNCVGSCPDTSVCVPRDPSRRCGRFAAFNCHELECRCKRGYQNEGGVASGPCVPACPKGGVINPVRNDPNQEAHCTYSTETKAITCTCACRDLKKELVNGHCVCKAGLEDVNGYCKPPCPADRQRDATTHDCVCIPPKVEEHGVCVTPCVGPGLGDTCTSTGTPCCEGQCIYKNNNDATGKCLEVGFATCPDSAENPLKACVDVSDAPGQATCGLPTCKALCNKVCNDNKEYEPNDCSNAGGGGNCQDVYSTFAPFPEFNGGPCCGCKRCK